MEQVIILLLLFINVSIIVLTSVSKDRWRIRCQQLKEYIKFLESAHPIEDESDGGNWLNERADRRAKCDIQDINYD
tara:strand:+ start:224 stop:451 length:228 start_codon:yes stop_codon:yes gene_type:complete